MSASGSATLSASDQPSLYPSIHRSAGGMYCFRGRTCVRFVLHQWPSPRLHPSGAHNPKPVACQPSKTVHLSLPPVARIRSAIREASSQLQEQFRHPVNVQGAATAHRISLLRYFTICSWCTLHFLEIVRGIQL